MTTPTNKPESAAQRVAREEWEARPKITASQLLEMFSVSFVERIDRAQREMLGESVKTLIGFTALDGTTKDENRLLDIASKNSEAYDDTIEDLMYEDEVLVALIDPVVRSDYRDSEAYTRATRLRRTVVAHQIFSQLGVEVEAADPAEIEGTASDETIQDAS